MGIKDIFLFGFDGTMNGVFENNSYLLFKSQFHFYLFLLLCRKAFSHNFKLSYPPYLRPKKDLRDFDRLSSKIESQVLRIHSDGYKVAKFKNLKEVDISYIMR